MRYRLTKQEQAATTRKRSYATPEALLARAHKDLYCTPEWAQILHSHSVLVNIVCMSPFRSVTLCNNYIHVLLPVTTTEMFCCQRNSSIRPSTSEMFSFAKRNKS